MNNNALFQDQYGNILLDNLDIINSLYPFYNFQIKGMEPQVSIIHPYGFGKTLYYKETKNNKSRFREQNQVVYQEFQKQVEKLKSSKKKTNEGNKDKSKKAGKFKDKCLNYTKKFGKMWLMISIIASYWAVYNPRRKTLENYQFLNSVEDIENNIVSIR